MPLERELFVPVCTIFVFVCTSKGTRYLVKWLSSLWEDYAKTEKRCISELFEVQTGTNDTLSNAVGRFSISCKMAEFPDGADYFLTPWYFLILWGTNLWYKTDTIEVRTNYNTLVFFIFDIIGRQVHIDFEKWNYYLVIFKGLGTHWI